MYAKFFGLKHEPFSIAPDPRYLFMSDRHREALAHLLYGVGGGGGFVLLSGEIGAGKTTVCRCFLEQIPRRCNVAYIFNPKLTVQELLKSVCDEFRIPYQHQGPGVETVKDYLDPLNEFLLKTHSVGQNNVLIIDEAQNLSPDVLEQLRLLTNLETSERKLLQIILIGQPELRTMLAQPELEQLAQRVIARFHLEALSEAETAQYIRHRLAVAGLARGKLFDTQAVERVHQLSRGIPRRINLLCDRALLGAYAEGKSRVDSDIVEKAASEVFDITRVLAPPRAAAGRMPAWGWGLVASTTALGVAGMASVAWLQHRSSPAAEPVVAKAAPAPAPVAASRAATALVAAASQATPTVAPSAPIVVAAPVLKASAEIASLFSSKQGSERKAWLELAPLWKLTLAEGDPCAQAQQAHVHCFRSSRGLGLIRQLDRPGILTLNDENGRATYALLTSLDKQSATLSMGGVSKTVPVTTLLKVWRGDFATFWRAPPGYVQSIVDGNSGPLVDTLATRLAIAQGEPVTADKRTYDAALKAKVAAFQQAHGLRPDGVAGPTTFMQLNRVTGVEEPRLRTGG
ncbi:MAG: AAA family ATPase [Aquabacterium sp.]|uniref:ExeA family protein n=1 Tax=Aquabacterium sp. TaxID=1872578 RepID=UPI00271F99C7|nr:ExeA family protein [Aquabacterium sp.]MDO9005389.1 AAA family ATPase [Aquabacterium sp.]